MKRIAYTTRATKQRRKLPAHAAKRIEAVLKRYAETGAGDVTALTARPGARLRAGDWRAIVLETADTITVIRLGHRSDIYD